MGIVKNTAVIKRLLHMFISGACVLFIQTFAVGYWFAAAIACGDAGDRTCLGRTISAVIVYIAPLLGAILVYVWLKSCHAALKFLLTVYVLELIPFILTGNLTSIGFLFGI